MSFMAIPAKAKALVAGSNTALQEPIVEDLSVRANSVAVIEENVLGSKTADGNIGAQITEEWEELVVLEMPKMRYPTCISKPKLESAVSSPPQSTGKLDNKTSRILERLEVPKQLKRKAASPTVSSTLPPDTSISVKKPLIPFGIGYTDSQATALSQPIKPNFQRLKRKR